jgi:diaminohydroxyphosphoribosylaminopyrimidine deaminase/5-amino-6-(5-phosphoribosylamino)uracil reductase
VDVTLGVLQREAMELNRFFVKHITTGVPYVHVKIAQTQDGYIGKLHGKSGYITSKQSLEIVHRWRAEYDAVLVGANTVKIDNPRLDVRLVRGRDPAVVIVDGRFSLTGKERVFASASRRPVYVCTTERAWARYVAKGRNLLANGVRLLTFKSKNERINLKTILRALYRQGIGSILVEGGRDIFSQCIEHNLADELTIFTSPKNFSDGVPALTPLGRKKVARWMVRHPFQSTCAGPDHVVTGKIS